VFVLLEKGSFFFFIDEKLPLLIKEDLNFLGGYYLAKEDF
jgi:hypothetical protein